jgi:hypothetical protein
MRSRYYKGRYRSFVKRVLFLFNCFLIVEPIYEYMRHSAMDFGSGP